MMMCNNHIRICCFVGFVCFALFALAIVCSQVWHFSFSLKRKYIFFSLSIRRRINHVSLTLVNSLFQVWDLKWHAHSIKRTPKAGEYGMREFLVDVAENATTMQSPANIAKVTALLRPTTPTSMTTDENEMTENIRVEDPLVFNVPEVPSEVRGVFHQPTGVVNYTALIEFVKNLSSSADENLQRWLHCHSPCAKMK